jgi:hypothetical protein
MRPDISCAVSHAAQVTPNSFDSSDIIALNNVVTYLRKAPKIVLKFAKLDHFSLRMLVYTDAIQASNEDLSIQVVYIVILTDHIKQESIVHYQSHKSQRVTGSSMAGETLAFADGFDNAFILRHDIENMFGQPVPLVMYTDSQALFNVLTRNKTATEYRLMVEVAAERQAYLNSTISNIDLIKSCYNLAD